MAGLEIAMKPVDGDPTGLVAELTGVLDGSTVQQFQDAVDGSFKGGVRKLVIDIAKVRYVNSTGLGAIIKHNDRLKAAGGGVALCKVPAKVKIVIEMLGLQAFIDLCPDERSAIDSLSKGRGGAPAPAAPPPPPAPSSFAPPSGPGAFAPPAPPAPGGFAPPPAPSGFAPPPAAGGGWGAPPAPPRPAPPPPPRAASGPQVVACGSCGVQVEVRGPGNWKCPRCYTLIQIGPDGQPKFMASDRPSPYEISLACTQEGAEALTHFVGALANRVVGNGNTVSQSVGEVIHVIASSAYGFDPKGIVHVSIETTPTEMRIKLADHGKTIDGSQVAAYFPNASRAMNEFDCKPHPKGGNVIRMVKRK